MYTWYESRKPFLEGGKGPVKGGSRIEEGEQIQNIRKKNVIMKFIVLSTRK